MSFVCHAVTTGGFDVPPRAIECADTNKTNENDNDNCVMDDGEEKYMKKNKCNEENVVDRKEGKICMLSESCLNFIRRQMLCYFTLNNRMHTAHGNKPNKCSIRQM